jgi:LmbE family N-acetylglucosaminyl deacetylase
MPAKMPLYRPEQLNEPDAGVGRLERVFLFATGREPDVFVDVEQVYEQKMAAAMAHLSQFPDGEESLAWMRELDRERGKTIDVPYAEAFKEVEVW